MHPFVGVEWQMMMTMKNQWGQINHTANQLQEGKQWMNDTYCVKLKHATSIHVRLMEIHVG